MTHDKPRVTRYKMHDKIIGFLVGKETKMVELCHKDITSQASHNDHKKSMLGYADGD